MNPYTLDHFAAFIGIDWADRKHDICLTTVPNGNEEFAVIEHSPKAIDDWALKLLIRFNGKPVALACELKKGPLIYALSKHSHIVLFPLQPAGVAKYRLAYVSSGAKDDPTDAALQLEYLISKFHHFRPLLPDSPQMRAIQQLVEYRRTCVAERVRITNRIISALKNYYPQPIDWFDVKSTTVFCDFIDRWPNFQSIKKARVSTLQRFFNDHNVRRQDTIDRRINAIKVATALTDDVGIITAYQLIVTTQLSLLRATLQAIKTVEQQIDELAGAHTDQRIFASFPGAGPAFCPRLMAAFGDNRERYHCASDIQKLAGVAPVLERSGKSNWVHWRYAAPTFLRQTFVEWAGESVHQSFWAHAYYHQQKQRGKHHATILRSLAYKWLRIMFVCWKNRTTYNESKYLNTLKAKQSPLLEFALKQP